MSASQSRAALADPTIVACTLTSSYAFGMAEGQCNTYLDNLRFVQRRSSEREWLAEVMEELGFLEEAHSASGRINDESLDENVSVSDVKTVQEHVQMIADGCFDGSINAIPR